MEEADRAHLRAGAARLGVPLREDVEERLVRYVDLLRTWNQKLNLTAVTEPRAIVDKHLLDSLVLVPFVAKLDPGSRVLDVGTGAGLPAVVLAVLAPHLRITAVDSIHKKITFVRAVARELGLSLQAEPVRLEARPVGDTFDAVVSRATFEPAEWVERGAPWVAPGGRVLAMLSAHQRAPDAPPGFSSAPGAEHDIAGARRRVLCYKRA